MNKPQWAVITGCSRGIGRGIAETLAESGLHLIGCARTATELATMQTEFASRFPTTVLHTLATDLSAPSAAAQLADFVLAHTQRVDLLVHNAGYYAPGTVTTADAGALERMLALHAQAPYYLTRHLLPALRAAPKAHIFFISSVAGRSVMPDRVAYSMSKFAQQALADGLRAELQPQGIRVTSLLPGATWSSAWQDSGVDADRLLRAADIGQLVWQAYSAPARVAIEEIVVRPRDFS